MRWLVCVALVACGRIDFDPLGGANQDAARFGDGKLVIDGSGSACMGTTTGCASSLISLANASSGNRSNDLAMFADNYRSVCGGAGGGDFGTEFMILQAGMYRFSVTASFDTVIYAFMNATCASAASNCIDNPGTSGEQLDLDLPQGADIVVVVDSNGGCGPVMLSYQGM